MSWRWTGTTKKQNFRRKREKKNRALTAIDEWMDDIAAAENGPFRSEGERLAFYYERQQRLRRGWERPRTCMFPRCSAKSIPRSHTLPRSGPLALVAEDGHVITPRFVRDDIYFTRVGIGEASTFPGFCSEHEREFGEIDRAKDVDDHRQWILQFFRTVCWEVRTLEHGCERFRRLSEDYEAVLRDHAAEALRRKLGEKVEVRYVTDIDSRQRVARKEREKLEVLKSEYMRDFFEPLCAAIHGEDPNLGLFIIDAQTEPLPVCLAGRGNFHCATPDGDLDVTTFLQVFPSEKGTKMALLAPAEGEKYLGTYVGNFLHDRFGALEMVESWMLHGTDHWFLRPSVWTSIPEERRVRIEAAFRDVTHSIGERATETIFDNVRAVEAAREEKERREGGEAQAIDATAEPNAAM